MPNVDFQDYESRLSQVAQLRKRFSANGTMSIPASNYLRGIYIFNRTANAVTGGIRIGTAAGGAQVVAAQAVAANDILRIADASVLIKGWTTTQTLFIEAVTAWNNAQLDIVVDLVPGRG